MIERYFRVAERGSTVPRELRGGLVTFMAMAYIIVLNPLILGSVTPTDPSAKTDALGGILPVAQVAAVTALVADRLDRRGRRAARSLRRCVAGTTGIRSTGRRCQYPFPAWGWRRGHWVPKDLLNRP